MPDQRLQRQEPLSARMLEATAGLSPTEALVALRRARQGEPPARPAAAAAADAIPKLPRADIPMAIAAAVAAVSGSREELADGTTPDLLAMAGHIDVCNANLVEGWLAWLHYPRVRLNLDIYEGNEKLGSCSADRVREDLRDAGYGDGGYAFSFLVPLETKVTDPARIRVGVRGTPLFLLPDAQTRRAKAPTSP